MYHLIYVSSAVNLFTEEQLRDLLEVSRRNNSACGVTGLLLYLGGNFIQVLEGEEPAVQETHHRILADPRHAGLITLMQGTIEQREFSEWSMGFKNVPRETGEKIPGYNDFLNQKSDPNERKSCALRLLEQFKNINR